ncbi:MAG: hypothetical protein WC974_08420 [Thermoplasmata archaeon]
MTHYENCYLTALQSGEEKKIESALRAFANMVCKEALPEIRKVFTHPSMGEFAQQVYYKIAESNIGGQAETHSYSEPVPQGGAVADKERIKYLEDVLFAKGAMVEAPCFCCGYNSEGYFQKENHPCAERHFKLMNKR